MSGVFVIHRLRGESNHEGRVYRTEAKTRMCLTKGRTSYCLRLHHESRTEPKANTGAGSRFYDNRARARGGGGGGYVF
jgi:hypothetical protein